MDRVVIITGASSGIGRATALKIAAPGTKLLLQARGGRDGEKVESFEQVADDARDKGAECAICISDLSVPRAGTELVEQAVSRFGRVDQIVSNAGFADSRKFGELGTEDLQTSLQTMTTAFFDIVTAALDHLQSSDCGRIVAVSSFVAHVVPDNKLFPVTAAAKSAIEGLARSLAVQLAPDQVSVNCVAPGFTQKETSGHSALGQAAWERAAEITPMGKLAQPQDIAALIAFLLEPDAGHITGQVIHVDGGLNLV